MDKKNAQIEKPTNYFEKRPTAKIQPSNPKSAELSSHKIQLLQRIIGNQTLRRLLKSGTINITAVNGSGGKIQRNDPPEMPKIQGQLTLSINYETGAAEVRLVGPEDTPVIKSPTIGIQRDANGQFHILIGGKDTVVTVDQIPTMLRSAIGETSKPGEKKQTQFRVPRYDQLWRSSLGRFATYTEYKITQMLTPDLMPLTPALYEALIESYRLSRQSLPLQTLPLPCP